MNFGVVNKWILRQESNDSEHIVGQAARGRQFSYQIYGSCAEWRATFAMSKMSNCHLDTFESHLTHLFPKPYSLILLQSIEF
jgi:hypothetical protein